MKGLDLVLLSMILHWHLFLKYFNSNNGVILTYHLQKRGY